MYNIQNQNNTLLDFKISPFQYYIKWFDDSFSMWMHHHKYAEIMYSSTGEFDVEISKDSSLKETQCLTIKQGSMIFIMPDTYHKMIMRNGCKSLVYNIEFLFNAGYEEIIQGLEKIVCIDFKYLFSMTSLKNLFTTPNGFSVIHDTEQVGTTLKELILSIDNGKNSIEDKLSIMIKQMNFFTEISKCLKQSKMGTISFIRKANSYILENYDKKITVDEIANYVGKSKSYLEHQYKKHTGHSILSFVNILRSQKAAKYLSNSTDTINEITKKVGFNNKNQFNYEFKKNFGISPSTFRKNKCNEKIDYSNEKYTSQAIDPNEQ